MHRILNFFVFSGFCAIFYGFARNAATRRSPETSGDSHGSIALWMKDEAEKERSRQMTGSSVTSGWVSSADGAVGAAVGSVTGSVTGSVAGSVAGSVGASVGVCAGAVAGACVAGSVGASVGASVGTAVGASVGA